MKIVEYENLIKKRKSCFLCGPNMHNPSIILEGKFDSSAIGPWSEWYGDLDADVLVIGKDWYNSSGFISQNGKVNVLDDTNRNLLQLLKWIGVDENVGLFFTNSVLCMKDGEKNQKLKSAWKSNCSHSFLRPVIEIIKPKIIIALGEDAFDSIKRVYRNEYPKLRCSYPKARDSTEPFIVGEMKLFSVVHPGRLGMANFGGMEGHKKSWMKIIPHIEALKG
ncbi:hypothetical protein LIT25_18350 [Bacillus sp. F19]|nr:hypothetical protein LIT25_18350 [Bacillus sp. F19]